MNRTLSWIGVALFIPASLFAEWASIPLDKAIGGSDMVVVGTLSDVLEKGNSGTLDIREVLWSKDGVPEKVRFNLTWTVLGACGPAVPTKPGTQGIWILKRDEQWTLHAGHPSCFAPPEKRQQVVDLISKLKKRDPPSPDSPSRCITAEKTTELNVAAPDCPACKSAEDVVPVINGGVVGFTDEQKTRAKRGEAVLGTPGCGGPYFDWACRKCGKKWHNDKRLDEKTVHAEGIVKRQDLEGGFWGIIGDDGRRYDPLDSLPEEFRKEGLRVQFSARIPEGQASIHMWGTIVAVISIRADDPAVPDCPDCKTSASTLPILWGMPTADAVAKAKRGEVILKGCIVPSSGEIPQWHCRKCGKEWK